MNTEETVHIALGSNLGDRASNLSLARSMLEALVTNLDCSSIYETPPWGVTDQPAFLNQVVRGNTLIPPHRLLDQLKRIEKKMGRQETIRFGPRLIDLDILLYGQRVVRSRRLQIPHPRMLERAFVLVPLVEISPGVIIPGTGNTARACLEHVDTNDIRKIEPLTNCVEEKA